MFGIIRGQVVNFWKNGKASDAVKLLKDKGQIFICSSCAQRGEFNDLHEDSFTRMHPQKPSV